MTKEQAKELLPIITAFAEGKTIQYKDVHGWRDIASTYINWDSGVSNYRIKPQAREFWIVNVDCVLTGFFKEHNAIDFSKQGNRNAEIIHVREVLSDEK